MHKPLVDADAAIKHLLRRLDDAASLRENPLVAHFFAGDGTEADDAALDRVRETLRAIVERSFRADDAGRARVHLARQRAIVVRCDLGGEAHKCVQDDLGLERRQFYRERQRARTRLARALLSLVPAHVEPVAVAIDAFSLALTHVHALRAAGDGQRALAAVAALRTDDARAVDALALHAELAAEYGRREAARGALAAARRRARENEPHDAATIALAEAHVAWLDGKVTRAAAAAERAARSLEAAVVRRSGADDELLATAHLQASISHHMLGGYDRTLAHLQAARAIVDRRSDLPARLTVNVLFHLGGAHAVMPGCGRFAETQLARAYEIATRHGLVCDVAHVALNLANLYLVLGDPRSLETGRAGLQLAARVLGPLEYAWSALSLAAVELDCGNVTEAIALARAGGKGAGDDGLRSALADTVEADALLRVDRPERAHALASKASDAFERAGSSRFLGYALRVASEASHRLGATAAARDGIRASVGLLERFGHPYSLATALQRSALITGDRTRERDARDLLATIRPNERSALSACGSPPPAAPAAARPSA